MRAWRTEPGNDNDAGCRKAYAPGLRYHDRVNRGELVGFVGDSGDANGIQPHLHFEVHKPSGRPIDPFQYLNKAPHLLFGRLRRYAKLAKKLDSARG